MPFFDRDGLQFYYHDEGQGVPVFFQHGLGGDVSQPLGLFRPGPGFRLLSFDARAHGETRPLGDPKKIAIAVSADDLVALMDRLGIERAVVGGISMGAAIALNATLRYPKRVLGLVLSRPAWLDRPLPENTRVFAHIAQCLLKYGAKDGLEYFMTTPEYLSMLREAPDCAQGMANQFVSPRAEECVARLERIPHDAPAHDREEWRSIRVPTLVLANHQDPIHPWEFGVVLAQTIPKAEFREITSKSVSPERHADDVQHALEDFLQLHFSNKANAPC